VEDPSPPNHDDSHQGNTFPVLPSPKSAVDASSPPRPSCGVDSLVTVRQETIDGFLLFGRVHHERGEPVRPDVEEWRILDARGTL
jgi:hypothetical protein